MKLVLLRFPVRSTNLYTNLYIYTDYLFRIAIYVTNTQPSCFLHSTFLNDKLKKNINKYNAENSNGLPTNSSDKPTYKCILVTF